jgi:hypothetical protein
MSLSGLTENQLLDKNKLEIVLAMEGSVHSDNSSPSYRLYLWCMFWHQSLLCHSSQICCRLKNMLCFLLNFNYLSVEHICSDPM